MAGMVLSLFHANAKGAYSGFSQQGPSSALDTRGESWLRGAQRTNQFGEANFETIYPGWYPGRVTHMHLVVLENTTPLLSSQIYFPDDVVRSVYADSAYSGWRDTEDGADLVLRGVSRGVLPRLEIRRQHGATDVGAVTIVVSEGG